MSNQKRGNRSKERDTEWQERVVQIRRVTKVVKGGKKLRLNPVLVILMLQAPIQSTRAFFFIIYFTRK